MPESIGQRFHDEISKYPQLTPDQWWNFLEQTILQWVPQEQLCHNPLTDYLESHHVDHYYDLTLENNNRHYYLTPEFTPKECVYYFYQFIGPGATMEEMEINFRI